MSDTLGKNISPYTLQPYGDGGNDDNSADILSSAYNPDKKAHRVTISNEYPVEVIDFEHDEIHEGRVFQYDTLFTSVADNAYARIHLYNDGVKQLHAQSFVTTEAKAYIRSYGDTTYSNAGTLVTPWNRNTESLIVATAKMYVTPTVNVLGAVRSIDIAGSGGTPARQVGGQSSSRVETIIGTGHDVMIEVQNKAGEAKDIVISVRWYEV